MKAKEDVSPQDLLNVPSYHLLPIEGINSPIHVLNSNALISMPQFKLRSPINATQQEVDLTKRYIGFNEQIKQSKKIMQSVIKGRRYTVDPAVNENTSVMT